MMALDAVYDREYDPGMDWATMIRQAVKRSGKTMYAVAKESGVSYARVHFFLAGKRDLRLGNAQRIAEAVGLELRPAKRAKGGA